MLIVEIIRLALFSTAVYSRRTSFSDFSNSFILNNAAGFADVCCVCSAGSRILEGGSSLGICSTATEDRAEVSESRP